MRYLATLLSLVGLALSSSAAAKNVVLIVADDMGKELGCYGNKAAQTPHLDRLATEGTRFQNAFCTTASCSASRSVILSGLHNHATGQYGHEHSFHHFRGFENLPTLPVLLQKGGYRTARIGKFHVGPEEVWKFEQALKGNARSPFEMANQCQPFVAARDDRPFFLYFCTADPHRSGTRDDGEPGKPDRFGNRPQGWPGIKEVKFDSKKIPVPSFLPDSAECRAELAQYYQSVTRVDQGIGRLIEVLKDAGKLDDTLIIFTSDNGIPFAGAKTTAYEPGVNLPLLVRHPVVKKRGVVSTALVSHVDLVPTILDYAGVKPDKAKFHGRSFLGTLEQPQPEGWDRVYGSHTFHEVTM